MKFKDFFLELLILFLFLSTIFHHNIFYNSYQIPKIFGFLTITLFIFFYLLFFNYKININITVIIIFILYYYFFTHIMFLKNSMGFYEFIFLAPIVFFIPLFYKINKYKFSLFLNIILFFSLLYGFYQFVFLEIKRPYSFFGNPIFFAEFTAILFPFAIFNLTHKNLKMFSIINLSLFFVILILCQSRGVLFSFFISFILLILMFIKTGNYQSFSGKNSVHVALVIVFIIFFTPGFFGTFKSFSYKIKSVFSPDKYDISGRILLAKSALQIFLDHPFFGAGPGSIKKFLQLKESEFLHKNDNLPFVNSSYAHNDYLQIISETGITGILIFLFLIFQIFYKLEKNIKNYKSNEQIFLLCVSSSIFFIIIESFFNFPLFIFPSCILFYFFLGLLYAGKNDYKKILRFSPKSKIMIILIVFPLIITFLKEIKKITSDIYLCFAISHTYSHAEEAENLFKKTIILNPESLLNLSLSADFYFHANKFEQSLQLFKKILKICPYSADIYYNIGVINELKQDYKKAIKNYKMALHFYPNFAPANLRLYNIYSQINPDKENEYLFHLHRAVKNSPVDYNLIFLKEMSIDNFNKKNN